eukprot:2229674-Pleurochrysis_carterae.AAC.1
MFACWCPPRQLLLYSAASLPDVGSADSGLVASKSESGGGGAGCERCARLDEGEDAEEGAATEAPQCKRQRTCWRPAQAVTRGQ